MKPEEQRIRIAEIIGYRKTKVWRMGPDGKRQDYWEHPSGEIHRRTTHLPYYTGCLNASHEMEKWLYTNHPDLWSDYIVAVEMITGSLSALHATAPQRCEALLKALNQWTLTDED